MKKLIIASVLFFSFCFAGVSQKIDRLSLFTGIGFPIGPNQYDDLIREPSLFKSFSNPIQAGVEVWFHSASNLHWGMYVGYVPFQGNNDRTNSNRYDNSSCQLLQVGPLLSVKLKSIWTSKVQTCAIFTPAITFLSLNNHENSIYSVTYFDGYSHTLVKYETVSLLTKVVFGANLVYEQSGFFNDRYRLFIREGIIAVFPGPGKAYPDKFLVMPFLSAGIAIDNRRDKWYFIKGK